MSFENNLLNEKLKEVFKYGEKGKGEDSRIHFQLEENLTKCYQDLTAFLDKKLEPKRELILIMVDFEKHLRKLLSLKFWLISPINDPMMKWVLGLVNLIHHTIVLENAYMWQTTFYVLTMEEMDVLKTLVQQNYCCYKDG